MKAFEATERKEIRTIAEDVVRLFTKRPTSVATKVVRAGSGIAVTSGTVTALNRQVTWVELLGTKDSANVTFTCPFPVAFGPNGAPLAHLMHKGDFPAWTTDNPPPASRWTLVFNQVIMGTPPDAGDYLAFTDLTMP